MIATVPVANNVDGQRVKQKEVTEIKEDDKAFDIPETWAWVKLGNVCTIARGGSPRPIKDYLTTASDGVNWIKIGDTEKNGKYIGSTAEKIKPSGVSKSRMVHVGDFLLTNSMSFGRPYILKVDGCIHDGWLVISQLNKVFDQEYLYWLLSSSYAYSQFCGKVSGAVVKNLNSDKVANSVFPLPPLAEQKRIVAKIEELLPLIDRYEKAWSRLEDFNKRFPVDMQKSILQMAIQGKLVEQRPEEGTGEELYRQIQAEKQKLIKEGKIKKEKPLPEISEDEIPFDIPESWMWVRMGDLAQLITKGSSPKWQGIRYVERGLLFVTSENVGVNALLLDNKKYVEERFTQLSPRSQLMKGDLLTNIVGASIGRTAVYNLDEPANINQAVCIIRLIDRELIRYILMYLNSTAAYNIMMSDKVDTARANISLTNICNFIVPLPPLAEQKRIVAQLEEILPLCDRLK